MTDRAPNRAGPGVLIRPARHADGDHILALGLPPTLGARGVDPQAQRRADLSPPSWISVRARQASALSALLLIVHRCRSDAGPDRAPPDPCFSSGRASAVRRRKRSCSWKVL